MDDIKVAYWNIEYDVIGLATRAEFQSHRTIIAASGYAPPRRSIIICAENDLAPTGRIAALGIAQTSQPVSTSRMRVRVDPFFLLDNLIDVDELKQEVIQFDDHHVVKALVEAIDSDTLMPKVFTIRSSHMILTALRNLSNEIVEIVDNLEREAGDLPSQDKLRLLEERDAVSTALQVANLEKSAYSELYATELPQIGTAFGLSIAPFHQMDTEDDLLAADLRRFDNSAEIIEMAGSAVIVNDDDVRLTVINVNRKDLERVYGVDLVYYDHINDKAITVQYKRLEKITESVNGSTKSKWVYRKRSEIMKQLSLMQKYTNALPASSDDWRLSSSPNFFKFVKAEDFDLYNRALLKGMYVPDEYLKLAIQEGKFQTGSRKGFQIGYDNTRYFTSSTFIDLVRRCWIGTRKIDKSSLAREVAVRAQQHEVVLALRNAGAA